MDQRVEWYPATPQGPSTDVNLCMNLWKTVQGVRNLNIDCNLCMQQSFINPSTYSTRHSNERLSMQGCTKRDFIPLRNTGSFHKKKTAVNINDARSTYHPHGGKKRRENNSVSCDNYCAPWIMRNYSAGMVGLHEEIDDFYQFIRPTQEEHCMREHVIQSVKDTVLQLWPSAKLDVFGSFRTSLFLPTSDIDIVLFGNWDNLPLWTLKEELIKKGIADDRTVKVLDRAAVPIIKFQHLETGVKVDICFNMKAGVNSIQLIKDFIKKYPNLPKLVFVLKQFLVMRDLNEVWTGGLSSYALLLLCVSFLQMHLRFDARSSSVNLGVLLMEFFELYGKNFNYDAVCIRVKNGGCYICKEEFRQQMDNGSTPSLLSIEDPLTLGNDLGRGSYGMLHVKAAFDAAYRTLCNAFRHIDYNSDINYSVSYLSLILAVPEDMIEYRKKACQRWRIISAPRAFLKTDLSRPSCTSPGYCSASSTDSDVDDQKLPFNRKPHCVQRLLHRANSADCLSFSDDFSRNLKDVRNGNPTRTHSADRLKPKSKSQLSLGRNRDIFIKDCNFLNKGSKKLTPIQKSAEVAALCLSNSIAGKNSLCSFTGKVNKQPASTNGTSKMALATNQTYTRRHFRHASSSSRDRLNPSRNLITSLNQNPVSMETASDDSVHLLR